MRVVAARVGLMIDSGPISQPMRQPVAAKASAEEICVSGLTFVESGLTSSREDGDGPVPHTRESCEANMFLVVIDKTVVL